MAYNIPTFLKKDGDALLFDKEGEFIFYVPEIYFDRGDALVVGEMINILGIMDYAIFDEKGKCTSGLKRFYFPTVMLTKPSSMDKQKNVKLTKSQPATDFRLLRYKKGDAIVVSTLVPESPYNIEDFLKMVLRAKLPNTIPIDKLHEYFIDNCAANGEDYGVSIQLFGIIIGEMARDPSNMHRAFRHTNWTDPTSYRMIPITDLPKYISPSQSITSENWDNAVIGAIMNPSDVDSPMEKLLMG